MDSETYSNAPKPKKGSKTRLPISSGNDYSKQLNSIAAQQTHLGETLSTVSQDVQKLSENTSTLLSEATKGLSLMKEASSRLDQALARSAEQPEQCGNVRVVCVGNPPAVSDAVPATVVQLSSGTANDEALLIIENSLTEMQMMSKRLEERLSSSEAALADLTVKLAEQDASLERQIGDAKSTAAERETLLQNSMIEMKTEAVERQTRNDQRLSDVHTQLLKTTDQLEALMARKVMSRLPVGNAHDAINNAFCNCCYFHRVGTHG
jgi:hypothetical protein